MILISITLQYMQQAQHDRDSALMSTKFAMTVEEVLQTSLMVNISGVMKQKRTRRQIKMLKVSADYVVTYRYTFLEEQGGKK